MAIFQDQVSLSADPYRPEKDSNNWKILISRNLNNLQGKACQEFIEGIQNLNDLIQDIPNIKIMSDCLYDFVGWKLYPVIGLLELKDYFDLLANKNFPVVTFLREDKYLDYSSRPDIWHDIFGHLPFLFSPVYGNLVQAIAQKWLIADEKQRKQLENVFWFTMEAGVCRENGERKIYGARLLSNKEEIEYAVSDRENVESFDFQKIFDFPVNTYRIQSTVFEIPSFGYLETIKDQLEELIKI